MRWESLRAVPTITEIYRTDLTFKTPTPVLALFTNTTSAAISVGETSFNSWVLPEAIKG
jgi:hypothetical protein